MELHEMHFLVVDDMEVVRRVNADQLRSFGVTRIATANNGAEALEYIRNHTSKGMRLDFVLSDWNMPVMNGLDLLKTVRADQTLAHLPFVMVTAEADRDHISQAIAAGVSDLLLKPYNAQKLRDKIVSTMLRSRRLGSSAKAVTHSPAPIEPLVVLVPADQPERVVGQLTILIVDDTTDNLRMMSGLFENEFRVRVAQNGEKALTICTSEDPPDLVLLDVMMPDMDGFEVARRMREHPASETIPIIFVTALDDVVSRRQGLDLGAMDFVRKPIDPIELKLRVANFMRYVELYKQRQAASDEMLAAARLREDIDRMLRHDLKGPLMGVAGLARQMRENDLMTTAQRNKLVLLEDTVAQVLDTIDMTAELFRIETGRYQAQPQPIPLGDLLHQVADLARLAFKFKNLTLSVDTDSPPGIEPPMAQGDLKLCQSAFHNLMKNACEAAPAGSTVQISLRDSTPLKVMIENRGTVPLAMRDMLFTKYATSKQNGTGLGMYSAKLLIEAQGGTILLDTFDEDDRTVVSVDLPR